MGLGCYSFGGDKTTGQHLGEKNASLHKGVWGHQDDQDTIATVELALSKGVNFFDTAEMYGDGYSEQILGEALKKSGYHRSQYYVATKISETFLQSDSIRQHLLASLSRLQLDYVDLYQIHWHSRAAVRSDKYSERPLKQEVPLMETLTSMALLQAEGRINHIGVCNFGVRDISTVLASGIRVSSNQVPYNLLWRGVEHELVQLCVDNSISILPWGALNQGLLTGKFSCADDVPPGRARSRLFSSARSQQRHGEPGLEEETFTAIHHITEISHQLGHSISNVSLAWLAHQFGVSSMMVGARNPQQLLNNLSFTTCQLTKSANEALNYCTLDLKTKLGANLDPYESEEYSRIY